MGDMKHTSVTIKVHWLATCLASPPRLTSRLSTQGEATRVAPADRSVEEVPTPVMTVGFGN
jgi:hypothetical protein